MSTQRLGRVKNLERYWSENLLDSSADIDLREVSEELIYSLDEFDNYPYERQLKISGGFIYYEDDRSGEPVPYPGEYEYRAGSGLFILDASSDRIRPKKVFAEINQNLSGGVELQRTFTLDRASLWEFFSSASKIDELEIKTEKGNYDAAILMELLRQDNPLDALRDADFDSPVNTLALRNVIEDIENPESVETLFDLGIDLYSTTIKKAKATYFDGEDFADLKFEGGILSVDGDTDVAREYVLQKFEQDVVYPSYT